MKMSNGKQQTNQDGFAGAGPAESFLSETKICWDSKSL